METWVICFDISDDRQRERVGNLLLGYGERVQRSVFEVGVEGRGELDELRRAIDAIVENDDNVRLYRLCAGCRDASMTLDGGRVAVFPAVTIV